MDARWPPSPNRLDTLLHSGEWSQRLPLLVGREFVLRHSQRPDVPIGVGRA